MSESLLTWGVQSKEGQFNQMRRSNKQQPILLLSVCVVIGFVSSLVIIFPADAEILVSSYLLPWILLVAIVTSLPSAYLLWRGRFQLFHPLVFPAWRHYVPVFVIGSLYHAYGNYVPSIVGRIRSPEEDIPLSLVYMASGFAAMCAGFLCPIGAAIGTQISIRLPKWQWRPAEVITPAICLLFVGEIFQVAAFRTGAIGYQSGFTAFSATLGTLSSLTSVASLLIWLSYFRCKRPQLGHYLGIALIIIAACYHLVLRGNKSSLLNDLMLAILAFSVSGRKLKLREITLVSVVLVMALVVGFSYGSIFREIRQTERVDSTVEYVQDAILAASTMWDSSIVETASFAIQRFLQRIELLTSVAVVVSQYDDLKPLEASYGIANNIWVSISTSLIPRPLWPGKPVVSDMRAYSALYFGRGDSSFAMTFEGDLLRNFGPLGIPTGMAILGFALRVIYAALAAGSSKSIWYLTCYCAILLSLNFESSYGPILPAWIRIFAVMAVTGIVLNWFIRRGSVSASLSPDPGK